MDSWDQSRLSKTVETKVRLCAATHRRFALRACRNMVYVCGRGEDGRGRCRIRAQSSSDAKGIVAPKTHVAANDVLGRFGLVPNASLVRVSGKLLLTVDDDEQSVFERR